MNVIDFSYIFSEPQNFKSNILLHIHLKKKKLKSNEMNKTVKHLC